jgi:hypothetical protein
MRTNRERGRLSAREVDDKELRQLPVVSVHVVIAIGRDSDVADAHQACRI